MNVGVSPATVSRVLKRHGLNKLKSLEPAEPVRRYERAHPGELLHIDIKKLGRFERVGHRITGDRRCGETRGAGFEFVHVDNGSCYRSKEFRDACRDLGLRHIRTRPYTPKTNGKAERFIQTALREWAYAQAYPTSNDRAAELPIWLHRYNWHRPHGSLKSKPPASRLGLDRDNLLRLHS